MSTRNLWVVSTAMWAGFAWGMTTVLLQSIHGTPTSPEDAATALTAVLFFSILGALAWAFYGFYRLGQRSRR